MTRLRRALLLGAVVAALAGAAVAIWRTVAPRPETAETIAGELRCPACQGESVADSSSPIAAAMREAIATQLAEGRTPDEVRQWFVDRYGPQVLGEPATAGWGVLLWLLPAAAAAVGVSVLLRRLRGRRAPPRGLARGRIRDVAGRGIGARRSWDLLAVAVVSLAVAVALASPDREISNSDDPLAESLSLASSLEDQGHFAEAADIYRDVAGRRPDPAVRLRLAYCLLRSDQPAAAAEAATSVVDEEPDNAQAVLLLGLAQRTLGLAEASATLQRFLTLDPDNEAAPQIRRLLEAPPS